jgi:hypothetical protein
VDGQVEPRIKSGDVYDGGEASVCFLACVLQQHWQVELKTGAAALAGEAYQRTLMRQRDAARQRQAEAHAAIGFAGAGQSVERLENALAL